MQPEKVEAALKRHTSCCYKMRTFLKQHYGGVGNCQATVEAPQEAGGAYSTNGFGSNQLSNCRKRARIVPPWAKCAMLRARKQGGIQRVMSAYGAEHGPMATLESGCLGVRLRVGEQQFPACTCSGKMRAEAVAARGARKVSSRTGTASRVRAEKQPHCDNGRRIDIT